MAVKIACGQQDVFSSGMLAKVYPKSVPNSSHNHVIDALDLRHGLAPT